MQWRPGTDPAKQTPMTFGVLVRGEVRFDNIVLDCNMDQQDADTLDLTDPEQTLEHSCMLGFRGTTRGRGGSPAGCTSASAG